MGETATGLSVEPVSKSASQSESNQDLDMAVEMVGDKETKHVVICLETEMRKMTIPAYQIYDFARGSVGRTVIFTINKLIA